MENRGNLIFQGRAPYVDMLPSPAGLPWRTWSVHSARRADSFIRERWRCSPAERLLRQAVKRWVVFLGAHRTAVHRCMAWWRSGAFCSANAHFGARRARRGRPPLRWDGLLATAHGARWDRSTLVPDRIVALGCRKPAAMHRGDFDVVHELLQWSPGEPGLILALGNAEELADRAIQDVERGSRASGT